ncbi:MAG: DEAD/DEAH box helicase [Planctomycetota bacterium]
MTTPTTDDRPGFETLGLSDPVLKAIQKIGYDTPSPIQAATIPHVLSGRDLIGQAQTGTGKTAAFALPILTNLDLHVAKPQALILAPTRELAIQVAEACQSYAANLKGFHVLPIYGGQPYEGQLRRLARGVHVIVGTPGRVMDHLKRGTLDLSALKTLVLDEADEMLRMGFIEDVEWIMEQTPSSRQVALFSATMPDAVARIAARHLDDPAVVELQATSSVTDNVRQRYLPLHWTQKVDALTRVLEATDYDATIVFVRTRKDTAELTTKLEARGYAAAPLSGDIAQQQRERTINRFKNGEIDVVVATDVAARGLDVDRIGHVINFDMPGDLEAYVHRVGRTGRAGREGAATLFVTPREQRWLHSIERATGQSIEKMSMPSAIDINQARIARFKQRITDTLGGDDLQLAQETLTDYCEEHAAKPLDVAVALARIVLGESPLLDEREQPTWSPKPDNRPARVKASDDTLRPYRIEVGRTHNVRAGNIVGAIANEANIDSAQIGRIIIERDFAIVYLPHDLPAAKIAHLRNVWVAGRQLHLAPATPQGNHRGRPTGAPPHQRSHSKPPYPKPGKPKPKFKPKPGNKPAYTKKPWTPRHTDAPAEPASAGGSPKPKKPKKPKTKHNAKDTAAAPGSKPKKPKKSKEKGVSKSKPRPKPKAKNAHKAKGKKPHKPSTRFKPK